MASCTVRACAASIEGCRGWIGTTAVPKSTSRNSCPTMANTVSVSGPKICDDQKLANPASRRRDARASVFSIEPVVSSPIAMRTSHVPSTTSVSFVSNDPQPTVSRRVGVVGAGQLARMMGEAARSAHVDITVLAEAMNDAAVATCAEVEIGEATDRNALARLAKRVDVITFDHELVDLELLHELESTGVELRPSSEALRFAVDK